jgi:hypothetical protein
MSNNSTHVHNRNFYSIDNLINDPIYNTQMENNNNSIHNQSNDEDCLKTNLKDINLIT